MPYCALRLTFVCIVAVASSVQAVTTSYHIGNSLTYDSQPLGIASFAASRGLEHSVGWHLRSAYTLGEILGDPEDVDISISDVGTFSHALPNNAWDIVTIQPHYPSTLGEDIDAVLTFIDLTRSNPANARTNFYIYQTWPLQPRPYRDRWLMSSPDVLSTPMSTSREYYEHLIERVRSQTDANVYMIPVGEVFYELDVKMRAGQLPGYSSVFALYRDGLHLKGATGQFIAGVTSFATILGQYPYELLNEDGAFYGSNDGFTPEQRGIVLEVIRDVLDKHPYSGVSMPPPLRADIDGNLRVDSTDLQVIQQSIGKVDLYDPDLNGGVDGRDFLEWQRHFTASVGPADLQRFEIADLNDDGLVNSEDCHAWRTSYGLDLGADVDGDGDTDGRDFLIWQRNQSTSQFDVNRDFLVDGVDLADWQQSFGYQSAADVSNDGTVDSADYAIWEQEHGRVWTFPYALSAPPLESQAASFGATYPVPELGSAVLAIVLLECTICCREFRVPKARERPH